MVDVYCDHIVTGPALSCPVLASLSTPSLKPALHVLIFVRTHAHPIAAFMHAVNSDLSLNVCARRSYHVCINLMRTVVLTSDVSCSQISLFYFLPYSGVKGILLLCLRGDTCAKLGADHQRDILRYNIY